VSLKILVMPAAGLFACALFGSTGVQAQRAAARTSVNTNIDRTTTVSTSTNINRIPTSAVNREPGVDRDVDIVDIGVDRRYGGYYGCCYEPHPIATAAMVAAAAVTAAAVIRTPPPSCSTVVAGAVSYQHCGSTWYQPQFVGSSLSYVVVSPPR